MQGPEVVVSVFNTLNTIDCRVGGIFLKNAGIRLDSEGSEIKLGKEMHLHCPLNDVNMEPSSSFVLYVLLA